MPTPILVTKFGKFGASKSKKPTKLRASGAIANCKAKITNKICQM